jgi:hypothetical protein
VKSKTCQGLFTAICCTGRYSQDVTWPGLPLDRALKLQPNLCFKAAGRSSKKKTRQGANIRSWVLWFLTPSMGKCTRVVHGPTIGVRPCTFLTLGMSYGCALLWMLCLHVVENEAVVQLKIGLIHYILVSFCKPRYSNILSLLRLQLWHPNSPISMWDSSSKRVTVFRSSRFLITSWVGPFVIAQGDFCINLALGNTQFEVVVVTEDFFQKRRGLWLSCCLLWIEVLCDICTTHYSFIPHLLNIMCV